MLSNTLKIMCVLLFSAAMLAQTGCACCAPKAKACEVTKSPCARGPCDPAPGEATAALPSNAKPGECYAKVFIPPQFKTVTERVLVRDASETIEVVPAQYEWVEEKVLVKDASTELEAVDAEFATRERTLQVNSGHTDWEVNKNATCFNPKEQPARDVFCLVNHPATQQTYQMQALVKPAHVQETCVPAQYETVRREKLVCAATTRKVCIPAEYENIEKTQKICDGRMAWKRIICDKQLGTDETVTINANGKASNATVNTRLATRP
jgi:hypothetical protein